jgi:hypothetical protein
MEIVNIVIIFFSTIVCVIWALRKKREIETFKINILDENQPLEDQNQTMLASEKEDLDYISELFQKTVIEMMNKVLKISLVILIIMSIFVWLLLEEKLNEFAQGIYFFLGSFSQIILGQIVFQNHRMFDPRIITFCRINKWVCLDHIIKLNSYITLMNQAINLAIFAFVYYSSTFFEIDMESDQMTEKNFERFHRRFLAYGFGSVFAFFLIKSLSKMFANASYMVCEILARQNSEGIEEDHAKNPAKILNNIAESYFKIFQNSLQYNALTNMGLCIFQDFFVTRSVYLLDRGFLNAVAILCLGMVGALFGMLWFRNLNKFKRSDRGEFNIKFSKMQGNGLKALIFTMILASAGAAFILNMTFPDSIAVYDPFQQKIKLRNLDWTDSLYMFLASSGLVLTLVLNSLFFTVQNSTVMKKMISATKISFSLTLLTSKIYACLACIFPLFSFFAVLYVNYSRGNIYGVAVECLGIITYFQMIQFFQNFKNIYFFFKSLIMARRIEEEKAIKNFNDIINTCRMFGKFSNGVALFILITLSFVILVDSFNIQIVDTIIVIEPYYLLGICSGVVIFYLLTALDIRCDSSFTRKFLRLIKTQCLKRINDEEYEPPVTFLGSELVSYGYLYQIITYSIPTLFVLGLMFSLFGKKMVAIVMFGCFIFVLLTSYYNLIKSELLLDIKGVFGENPNIKRGKGIDPVYVAMLSNFVGSSEKNYSVDPHSKLLFLFCSAMMCSEYFIDSTGILNRIQGIIVNNAN